MNSPLDGLRPGVRLRGRTPSAGAAGEGGVPFVDLAAQYRAIGPEIDVAMAAVVRRGDFILGEAVGAFERAFAEYVGVAHAIGVSSGLDALRLSLEVLGIGAGDEVILPANTFVATALAVTAVGARPVLVDCDADTYNIAVGQVEDAVTDRTRAIMPVHLTGQAADMGPLLALAERRGLAVVEDACQAHGARYDGRRCGSLGELGCFSFYPGKNLGGYGDGGMITTDDAALADALRLLRNYGQREKYVHTVLGTSARLDTLQAAVLGAKLPHLDGWNTARAGHAARYRDLLASVGDIMFQAPVPHATHVYHLFVVETDRRDDLQRHLAEAGVQTGIHYPIPIHLQPAYRGLGYGVGAFPAAEALAGRMLSLPMYAELTEAQIEAVAGAVRGFFDGGGRDGRRA